MKRCVALLMGAVCLWGASAWAQLGVPLTGGPGAQESEGIRVGVGAAYGLSISAANNRDILSYGGRFEYAKPGGWLFMADLGLVSPGDDDLGLGADSGVAGQLGVTYALDRPWDPVDTAVRGTAGWASYKEQSGVEVSWTSFTLGVLAGKSMDPWAPYGFLGLRWLREEVKAFGIKDDRWLVSPAAGVGATVAFTPAFEAYGEFVYVGGAWFAAGVRWAF